MMKNIWKKEKSTARGEELGNVKMNEPVNSEVYTRVKQSWLSATGSCGNCCGGRTRSFNNSYSENFAKI